MLAQTFEDEQHYKSNKGGLIMGGGGAPSGGINRVVGRIGSLKATGIPNSRTDLYNEQGEKIQSRWYGPDGRAIRNRDYQHGDGTGQIPFPHDHDWKWENRIPRGKDHLEPDWRWN